MYYPMRFPTWLIYLGAFLIFATILTHNWSDSDHPKPSKTIPPTLHGNFLHITDLHPDPYYTTNATARSSCHVKDIELYKKPKHMKKGKAGPWGAPATICDSPMGLVNTTFQWLEKHWSNKLDFVIWTGDNSRHDNDDTRPRKLHEVFDLNRMIAKKFLDLFAANKRRLPRGVKSAPLLIPIVPSLGNNDLHPNNIIEAGPNHILKAYTDIWSAFIPSKQLDTFRRGGYYFTEVIPGRLIVISLNTMYFYDANTAVRGCKSESEPGTAEMKWLNNVLRNARKSGVKAYVTGHVAPTKKHYTPSCWLEYGKIAHRYHDVILGHLYGHSNMDHFYFIKRRSNKKSRANLADAYYGDDDDDDFEMVENEEVATSKNLQSEDSEVDTASENLQSKDSEVDTTSENLQSKDSEVDTQSKDGEVGTTVFDVNHYIHGLFSHFKAIPSRYNKMADRYAVIHVNPSVIPTFFPALRIYHYNATQFEALNTQDDSKERFPWGDSPDEEIDYDDDDEEEDEDVEDGKKKRRPHPPHDPNSPPHRNTFLTPVGYTQYFVNLTKANQFPDITPEYEVEYTTMRDYHMKDLTINSWLSLARRIANNGLKSSLGKKFREHLVVGTKDVVRNRKAGTECVEGGCGRLKGPEDYLASLGGF